MLDRIIAKIDAIMLCNEERAGEVNFNSEQFLLGELRRLQGFIQGYQEGKEKDGKN